MTSQLRDAALALSTIFIDFIIVMSLTPLKCQYAIITTILNACEPSGKRNFRLSLFDTRLCMDCWRITRLMSYSQPKILFFKSRHPKRLYLQLNLQLKFWDFDILSCKSNFIIIIEISKVTYIYKDLSFKTRKNI